MISERSRVVPRRGRAAAAATRVVNQPTSRRKWSRTLSRQVFLYDPPDRFVAGTVGLPGRRTFFLQASSGGRVTCVALEKTQVAALAERVDELLVEVVRRTGGKSPVPAVAPMDVTDTA